MFNSTRQSGSSISSMSLNSLNHSLMKLKFKLNNEQFFLKSYEQTNYTSKGFDTKSIILNSPLIKLKKSFFIKSVSQSPIYNISKNEKETSPKKKYSPKTIYIRKIKKNNCYYDNIPNIKPLPYNTNKTKPIQNAIEKIKTMNSKISFMKKISNCLYTKFLLSRIKKTSKEQENIMHNILTSNSFNSSYSIKDKNINLDDSLEMSKNNPSGNSIYRLPFLHKMREAHPYQMIHKSNSQKILRKIKIINRKCNISMNNSIIKEY